MIFLLGAAILTILAQLAAAHPTADRPPAPSIKTNSAAWASFCNDGACTDGCGEWVNLANPGCLGESGRGSIKFKADSNPDIRGGLVYSPGDSCNCQTEFNPFAYSGQGCMALNASITYEAFSYRLIGILDMQCPDKGSNC